MLHWFVGSYNDALPASTSAHSVSHPASDKPLALPTEGDYFTHFATAYASVAVANAAATSSATAKIAAPASLHLDCAHGVGYGAARKLAAAVAAAAPAAAARFGPTLHCGSEAGADPAVVDANLNNKCGADFVQKEKACPPAVAAAGAWAAAAAAAASASADQVRFASLDGDADRLVYYHSDEAGALKLVDGDRLAAALCQYLQSLLTLSNAANAAGNGNGDGALRLGVVQTAYANSASSRFVESLGGWERVVTCTGVKYLHAAALDFDVGVYFEANGHGTVHLSPKALQYIANAGADAALSAALAPEGKAALAALCALPRVINPYIGDALSCLLLLELAQEALGGSGNGLIAWSAMYTDLASKMDKVVVPDRRVVTTTNAEQTCVTPAGLQAAVDAAVAPVASGRAFVRPSGTEDIVRVFAEAESQEQADALCKTVQALVAEYCAKC